MNSSQMKNSGDTESGELQHIHLDIFNKIKYLVQFGQERGILDSPNRQLSISLINRKYVSVSITLLKSRSSNHIILTK